MNELQTTQANSAQMVRIAALDADLEHVKEVIRENLGAGGMSEYDLTRITIPGGGGIAFEVTDLDGTRAESTINCIILFARDSRGYWKKSYDEQGGVPPDCHSDDCITGIGDPGGNCQSCALAQFGSSRNGRGQACTQNRQLFILRSGSGSIIPEVFSAPPTSLGGLKKYSLMLGGRNVGLSGVVTEIGLEKDKTPEGKPYSKATFKPVRPLTAEEVTKVKEIAAIFRPLVQKPITTSAQPAGPTPNNEQAFE